ncbi:MAG: hypothetical protein WCT03_07190, partial [Candidatus Obscuribacterales bacterium]
MKRTLLALLSALTLAFVGLFASLSQAQAAVTCTVQSIPNNGTGKPAFTHNALYYCGAVTATEAGKARNAINDLKIHSRASLDDGHHVFYLFANQADYALYSTTPPPIGTPALPNVAIPLGAQGQTWNTSSTPSDWYSVIFLDRLEPLSSAVKNAKALENAVNHEAGHHFDARYSSLLGGLGFASEVQSTFGIKATGAQLTVGGGSPYTLGNKIKLTLSLLNADPSDAYLGTYTNASGATVYSFEKELTAVGETPNSITAWFVSQINGSPNLAGKGIKAVATTPASATFTIHSEGKYIVKYENAYVGTTFSFYQFAEHDWSEFIKSTVVKCGTNGLWSNTQDMNNSFICAGADGKDASLNTPYIGKDNGEIALKAWPYFYSLDNQTGLYRFAELWAEMTARITGVSEGGPKTPDRPLTNFFLCT